MFADESSTERADALVLRIKSNIEGLHSQLEEASGVLERSKRRLGRGSQAGMEASNLVGVLKEEFVKTTSGFKKVLEERSDGMKSAKDRKRRVLGEGEGEGEHAEERVDLLTLMNKPKVYGGNGGADGNNKGFNPTGNMGMGLGGGGLGGGGMGMPKLDLTSGMIAMRNQDEYGSLPAGESSSQLPRPRKFPRFFFCIYFLFSTSNSSQNK